MINTLLLTWTISPYQDVKNQWYHSTSLDADKRLQEYISTIIYYISNSDFTHIVFCENSGFIITQKNIDTINSLCKFYNKQFELLQFKWNHEELKNRGYKYWEWECIDYAFNNSKFLKKSSSRFKITWRYKYRNINDIIKERENEDRYFYRFSFPFLYWCVSEIFKCTNKIYWEYLYNIKELVDFKKPTWLRSYEMMIFYKLKPILKKLPPLKSLPISHLMKQKWWWTNRNLLFQLTFNKFFLKKHLLHRWWFIDRFYNLFWNFYCKVRLKIK